MRLNILRTCQIVVWFLGTVSCLAQNTNLNGLKLKLNKDSILVELAHANKLMGTCLQTFQPSEAIVYFRQSLEAYKEAGNKEEVTLLNQMIATAFFYMDEHDKQLSHLKKALQDALDLDNTELEINLLYKIAKAYCCLNNYDLAKEYLSMALQESNHHDQWMLEEIMIGQAEIEFQKGNYQSSIELSNEALSRVSEKEQIQAEIACLCNIAGCLIELKQYHEAQAILEKCLTMTHPDDDTLDNCKALQLMASLYYKTGNFEKAYLLQQQLEQITEQKHSLEQLQKTSDRLLDAEMQHLNMKLTYLESIYLEQNKQITKTNAILVVLVIFACGGIIFFTLTRNSFKNLKFEKIRFLNEQAVLFGRQKSISGKYQSTLQKKDSLQKKNHDLAVLDRTKSELFKAISNDLQMPLVQLQQKLSHLMIDIGEDQFRQATSGLTTVVGDLALLLENLLQWSKYQSQTINPKPRYTEITALVNDTVNYQKFSAAEKNIALSNALIHYIYVYVDEEMLKILLKTLVQNIVKLSESDAAIIISGDKDRQNGWLQINYTGQMPLKQTFLQQSQAVNYDSETSELGKAIILGWMLCQSLVKANNGKIIVEEISDEAFRVVLYFPLEEVK